MTVGELIRQLQRFDDHTPIGFMPKECCGGGFPVWKDCHIVEDFEYGPDDEEILTGDITIMLEGEEE